MNFGQMNQQFEDAKLEEQLRALPQPNIWTKVLADRRRERQAIQKAAFAEKLARYKPGSTRPLGGFLHVRTFP